jgi:hypothetical protein
VLQVCVGDGHVAMIASVLQKSPKEVRKKNGAQKDDTNHFFSFSLSKEKQNNCVDTLLVRNKNFTSYFCSSKTNIVLFFVFIKKKTQRKQRKKYFRFDDFNHR